VLEPCPLFRSGGESSKPPEGRASRAGNAGEVVWYGMKYVAKMEIQVKTYLKGAPCVGYASLCPSPRDAFRQESGTGVTRQADMTRS